ncbi:alpha/beta hydrolase [Wukongibacter baidiensis]|uniref:alpha/beta hydrolase n=1 Tax=Wukongibacter baidiensis TaxID=1723361 RepID=UPI003D7FF37F
MEAAISTSGRIKSFDNTNLYYMKDTTIKPRAIVIIIHGFGEHLGRYEYVKDKLIQYGYGVFRLDNRGHGKSEGERGHINHFKDFAKDVDAFTDLVRKENPNIPIFVLGHSMGGFISVLYGILYKNKIDGQILSAAATMTPSRVKGVKVKALKLVNKVFPKIRMKNPMLRYLLKNGEDELVLRSATLNLYTQFLADGIEWIRENFESYEYPCLILHGGDDREIAKEASEQLYSSISSVDKEIKIYDGLYHEMIKQKDRDMVLYDIHKWIENRIN